MRKGISPLIAAVLLIAFTIAVAGLAGPFLTEITQKAQGDTINKSQTIVDSSNVRLEVMSASYNHSTEVYDITIRNSGTDPVNNLTATVFGDDPKQVKINKKLEAGEVHTFNISRIGETTRLEVEADNIPVKTDEELPEADTTKAEEIEYFEDGDVSEYSGDAGDFSAQTGTVYKGEYALEGSPTGGGNEDILTVDYNLSSGNTYRYNIYFTDSGSTATHGYVFFGLPDESTLSGYRVGLSPEGDIFNLYRYDSGSNTKIDDTSYDPSTNEWYEVEFKWGSGGSLEAKLYDSNDNQVASLSGTDSNYKSGGVGWRAHNNEDTHKIYFDHLREKD